MRVPALAALIVFLDQLTKQAVVTHLKPVASHTVIPGFFNLSYVENPGAAWGMLAGRQMFLIAFSLLTLAFLIWKRRTLFAPLWGGALTMSLLFGGVIGNLIDRVRLNYVVDFLDFHWKQAYHFPAFNVADAAITVGAACLILDELLRVRRER